MCPGRAGEDLDDAKAADRRSLAEYRKQYRAYYHAFATPDSPALRDASPTVVLIPGLGMFSFGKNKTEARITGEFYTNAIHVMEGASLLAEGEVQRHRLPAMPPGMDPASFKVFTNYVALPALEAFRIEYWALEEAKIRRQPPEKELSRRIALGGRRQPAALAAKWRCWPLHAARTWWSPTAMWKRARALPSELDSRHFAGIHLPRRR